MHTIFPYQSAVLILSFFKTFVMKKINISLLCLALCSLFAFTASAQTTAYETQNMGWHIGKFKIKKLDFSLGYESDYITNMDYRFFVEQMPDVQQARLDELNFEVSEVESGICENPSINVGITLQPEKYPFLEWRSALAVKPNRVDAMTYYNNSHYEGNYMNISGTHAEFAVESAMIVKLPVLSFFNLYMGAGTNIGVTTSNQTCVFTSLDLTAEDISFRNINEINEGVPAGRFGSGDGYSECFDTGSQLNQRVFGQLGAGLIFFDRVEVGFDIKYGIGYRAVPARTIDRTHIVATNLNLRYILK